MKLSLSEALACARETHALVLGSGALAQSGKVFNEQFPGKSAVIVADPDTFKLAGQIVTQSLANAGVNSLPPFIFRDPALYAEFRFVEELENSLNQHQAIPIAIGAGTLNDLTKLAAHRCRREGYMCVATAASMDGYTAFGASITFQGAKQTFNCPAPRAVIADVDLIRRAPREMTASGYADMAAKITAGADWILADAFGVEPIDQRAWEIVQGGLQEALADPEGTAAGEASAILPLIEGLMMGGFAMQWAKSSRPASGAEHQFSHLWDMEHHTHNGAVPSHGFKVGVATLAIARFYEALLDFDFTPLKIQPGVEEPEERIREMFAGTDLNKLASIEREIASPTSASPRVGEAIEIGGRPHRFD
jgi:glycerol-1-phosphate dehydrogenase [NAD(P)+]